MEDDKVYVAVGKEMKERRSTLGWVLTKSRGRNISAVHVHVPAEIFTLPDGSEVPVTSLSDTEQEEFRECERREVQRILDDCTQMCASFQVSSENIYIEKESITQGILELISQLKIKILVMGAAKNNRYTRRMVTPMSRKAKFVLRYAPDYCRIWFICKNQLVCTREVFLQPTVDSEEMLSTLMHNINKLDRLSKIKLSPHLPICSPKVEFARGSCRPSFIKGLAHLSLALSGRLYNKEFDSKKTMVEKLAKGKEEIENIKRLWKVVSPELHKSLDKQLLLETRVATYSAEVKELEQKTISAMYMLQKFKNKRDKYEMERNKALQENKELKKLVARGPSCSQFSYSELLKATNDFDPTLIIEKGGYWCTYKGSLGRTEVAIKMLNSSSTLGPREFDREVAILSKLRHPRIVVLIGVCPEPCALVYEYLSGGSLEDRLLRKNNSPPLKWQTRIQIAKDIYSALIFIHSCLPSCSIIHGNLKTSNVLLDDNFSAKLSNFGICHVISGSDSSTSLDIGPGIISTELTPKYDVYSFGIILFHLLTGINTVGVATEVKYALLSDGLSSILDSSAGVWPLVQAQKIAHLALQCTDLNPGNRPDLESEVWNVLRPGKVSLCGLSTLKPAYEQAPHHFKCPISMDIMENPHIASDGYTYDEKEIKKWFEGDHNTSPMTGLPLENLSLIPNHSLRSAIQDWLQHTQIV
ncbi:hypothetical protein vseg_009348 [Gypsophila vaccaria]